MANELELISQGTGTRYCIIRRHSDYKVWDVTNTTWATYAAGSIGDYDVVLTARSGDLWQADFPTSITAGLRCRLIYYKQQGASPHDSDDLILTATDVTWNGTTTEAGGSVALSAYALTSLVSLKRYMRITSSAEDTLLTELINAVSDKVERLTNRQFVARNYRERVSGNKNDVLVLKYRPVIYVDRVAFGSENAVSVSATGFAKASISVNDSGVRLYTISTAGIAIRTDLTFASYLSSGTMATAIGVVSGWTASKLIDCSSYDFNMVAGMGCLDVTKYLTWPDSDEQVAYVDNDRGVIGFVQGQDSFISSGLSLYPAYSGFKNYLIEYNAGYATVPDDLAMLTNEICTDIYNKGKKDRTVFSERLGDWFYMLTNETVLTDGQLARLRQWSEIAIGGNL